MAFNIDLDRGVHTRSDPQTGMDVHMYVDEPGVYRSSHGNVIDTAIAARAGFPIEEQAKAKRRQDALKAAHDKVLRELDEANTGERIVLAERDGFKIIDIGYDRYMVQDPDGDNLTPKPLNKREAVVLLEELVPEGKTEGAEDGTK